MVLNNNFLNEYLSSLDFDPSHIAFKFKQAINFIRFGHIDHDAKILDLDSFGKTVYDLMSEKNKRNIKELIELLPPPIFSTQIQMTNIDTGAAVTLGELSSGEKQWNYCISTVLYHLNNLDSIRRSNHGLNYYNRVLIILEEIELYFHPEMQKRFVQHIIESIRQLKLHNIEHIQIIMVTHSPFVLSDIPSKNILFLNKGGPIPADDIGLTFGGNIHELLAKGFFLNDGLVGEYSQYKINTIIERLQKESDPVQTEEYTELLKTISLIGEDFLREKLIEMLNRKTIPITRKEEIKLLEDRLKMLKREQNND
nr:ATP-binding protein [Niastella koreensis]